MGQPEGYKELSSKAKGIYGKQLAALLWMEQNEIWLRAMGWNGLNKQDQLAALNMNGASKIFNDLQAEWRKWLVYYDIFCYGDTTQCDDYIKGTQLRKKWNLWYRAEFRKILSQCMEPPICLASIRDCVSIFLIALRYLCEETVRGNPCTYKPTDQEWRCMGNAAIATFLIQWLMGQREMRLKISDFSKTYFKQLIDSEQQKEENIEKIDTETRYKALLKACDDICIMQIMREIQADEEGSKIKRPPKDERKFSLPTLYAMGYTAWSKLDTRWDGKCMRIFQYISERKTSLDVTRKNPEISAACQSYVKVLENISSWGEKAITGDVDAARNYVVGSMMVMEQEEAYRLFFASASAAESQRRKQKKRKEKGEEELMVGVLARLTASRDWIRNSIRDIQDPTKVSTDAFETAHNILNYKQDIRYIYSATPEQQVFYMGKTQILRYSLLYILVELRELFPKEKLHKWEALDYQEAAQFFKEKYNVVEALLEIPFPEYEEPQRSKGDGKRRRRKKDHYDRMRELFVMMQSWPEKYGVGLDKISSPYETYKKAKLR